MCLCDADVSSVSQTPTLEKYIKDNLLPVRNIAKAGKLQKCQNYTKG